MFGGIRETPPKKSKKTTGKTKKRILAERVDRSCMGGEVERRNESFVYGGGVCARSFVVRMAVVAHGAAVQKQTDAAPVTIMCYMSLSSGCTG